MKALGLKEEEEELNLSGTKMTNSSDLQEFG
jgi:hypothetical protein